MLESLLFIILFCGLPVVWHRLLGAAGLSLLRISIPSLVILAFYVYQYIGMPVLYFQLDEYRVESGVVDQTRVLAIFLFTSLTITLMILGFVLGRTYFGALHVFKREEILACSALQSLGLFALFGICAAVLALYVSQIGFANIAIAQVLSSGGEFDAMVARSQMGNAFEGRYHWYYLFMNKLLVFTVFALFAQMLIRPSLHLGVPLVLVLGIAVFAMIMATEKAPLANLLIGLFIVYVLVRRNGVVPKLPTVVAGLVLVSIMMLFYALFMGVDTPLRSLSSVGSRVFTGQIQPAYHYLEMFPDHHDFLMGRSFPNPAGLLPFDYYHLTFEVMNWAYPEFIAQGIVGSMPTVYWAEMYANFGALGVLVVPVFVGLVLYWLDSFVRRFRSDALTVALLVWLGMHLKSLSGTLLSSYLLDIYLYAVILAFLSIVLFGGYGTISIRRRRTSIKLIHHDSASMSDGRQRT